MFTVSRQFFDRYQVSEASLAQISQASQADALRCRVLMRPMLTIFRPKHSQDRNVEGCEIRIEDGVAANGPGDGQGSVLDSTTPECRLAVKVACKHGIAKNYKIYYEPCDALYAIYSKDNCPNRWLVAPKLMTEWISHFNPKLEEITFICSNESVIIRSFAEGGFTNIAEGTSAKDSIKQSLQTQLQIDTEDFDIYHVPQHTELTFSFREFRAILAFAEQTNLQLSAYFDTGGKPILFAAQSTDHISVDIVLATLAETMTNSSISSTPNPNPNHGGSQAPSTVGRPPPTQSSASASVGGVSHQHHPSSQANSQRGYLPPTSTTSTPSAYHFHSIQSQASRHEPLGHVASQTSEVTTPLNHTPPAIPLTTTASAARYSAHAAQSPHRGPPSAMPPTPSIRRLPMDHSTTPTTLINRSANTHSAAATTTPAHRALFGPSSFGSFPGPPNASLAETPYSSVSLTPGLPPSYSPDAHMSYDSPVGSNYMGRESPSSMPHSTTPVSSSASGLPTRGPRTPAPQLLPSSKTSSMTLESTILQRNSSAVNSASSVISLRSERVHSAGLSSSSGLGISLQHPAALMDGEMQETPQIHRPKLLFENDGDIPFVTSRGPSDGRLSISYDSAPPEASPPAPASTSGTSIPTATASQRSSTSLFPSSLGSVAPPPLLNRHNQAAWAQAQSYHPSVGPSQSSIRSNPSTVLLSSRSG
ncbi:hypothetical protein H4R33_002567, partial [Dimargaris cristalligena]